MGKFVEGRRQLERHHTPAVHLKQLHGVEVEEEFGGGRWTAKAMVRFSYVEKKRRIVSSSCSSSDSCGSFVGERGEEREPMEREHDSPPVERRGASDTITVTVDPDTLDCPICFEPLTPPILQCHNGHVTCSGCSNKMKSKCYVCPYPLGPGRCLALEKILESARMPCPYADNGCRESLPYARRASHIEGCHHSPCFCPFPGCEFGGYLHQMLAHFTVNHQGWTSFKYNVPFSVSIRGSTSFQILLGEDDVFYLLNTKVISVATGSLVTLNCIHPNIANGDVRYELTVAGRGGSCLSLSAPVLGLKRRWEGVSPSKEFLLIPRSFFEGRVNLEVRVCRARG